MNRKILLLVLIILGGCTARTPEGPPSPSFDTTDFNFGRIPENTVVTHIYRLTNQGGDSLFVSSLRPHCGCTKAPLEDSLAMAGEEIEIELRFRSKGFRGSARKSASVSLDLGKSTKHDMLYFDAFVDTATIPFTNGDLGVNPYVLVLDSETEVETLTVENRIAAEKTVKVVDHQPDRIELSWTEKELGPRESAHLVVRRKIHPRRLVASITLEIEGKGNSRITVPIANKPPPPKVPKPRRKIHSPEPEPFSY